MEQPTDSPPPQHENVQPVMQPQSDAGEPSRGCRKLTRRAAWISGRHSGIGRARALLGAQGVAACALFYLNGHKDGAETERLGETAGHRALGLTGTWARRRWVPDALYTSSADGARRASLSTTSTSRPRSCACRTRRVSRLNGRSGPLSSGAFISRAALPQMHAGAALINTTSVTAFRRNVHLIDNSATKGSNVAFTRSSSQALAVRGLQVSGVAPEPIWTPLITPTGSCGGGPASGRKSRLQALGSRLKWRPATGVPGFTRLVLHNGAGTAPSWRRDH